MKRTTLFRAPAALGRTGTGIAALTAAFGLLTTATGHADAFVPLPDGTEAGPGLTLTRTGESAVVSPSMAANGAGRVTWVSGTVTADITRTPVVTEPGPYSTPENIPGTNNSSTHGVSQVNTGYIVGCQVSIGDRAVSLGASASVSTTQIGVSGSAGIQIGPGKSDSCRSASRISPARARTPSVTGTTRWRSKAAAAMPRPAPTPWSKSSGTTIPRPPSTVRLSASADPVTDTPAQADNHQNDEVHRQ